MKIHVNKNKHAVSGKAVVIDENFTSLFGKEMFLDSITIYRNKQGRLCMFVLLKEFEDDVLCYYFGPDQIKLIE